MKFIFLGLGNPGEEYSETKHNTGAIVVKELARLFDFPDFNFDKNLNSDVSSGNVGKNSIAFIIPKTFMNKSGDVLKKLKLEKKDSEKVVVIYDDLDLPFLKTKFSFNKSSGGHKGLESIIKALKTESFYRVRVGISKILKSGNIKKPKGEEEVIKFIMKSFTEDEVKEIKKLSKKIKEAISVFIENGYEKTATFLNS